MHTALPAPERVSADAERAIAARESSLHLSPISTWETLVLARKGRLSLTPSPTEWVLDALRRPAPTAVPLSHGITLRSETLEGLASEDPADRFLVATALEHQLVLVTADAAMRDFEPVATLWYGVRPDGSRRARVEGQEIPKVLTTPPMC